jgi:phosphate transport system ATP-binding protein
MTGLPAIVDRIGRHRIRGRPPSRPGTVASPSTGSERSALVAPRVESSIDGRETSAEIKADVRGLRFFYGRHEAVKGVDLQIARHRIAALIGPSGCGKTTLLRCFNRMHDLFPDTRYEGEIVLHPEGRNIIAPEVSPVEMRLRIGMVFQKPNPFPKTIFENIAYGLRLRGVRGGELIGRVETALRDAALWDEVRDRLGESAYALSGGQQQRLCIARALAVDPEMILFDEPTSALDPIATSKIEDLMLEIRERVTILIVTHNMQQAARVSDTTGFMYLGEMIEVGPTVQIFENPKQKLTSDYITGRFG